MRRLAVHSTLAATLTVTLLLGPGRAAVADAPPIFDQRPYTAVKQAAQETGKWLVVKGTATWCMPCKQMDKTTWRDKKVVAWLEEHALVSAVDVDEQQALAKQLSIRAMPTIIALKDGREFDRVVGYQSPDDFLAWLEGLSEGRTVLDALRKRAGSRDAPPGQIDLQARMHLARVLRERGKLAEASEEYIWLWENVAKINPAYVGVRGSFLASDLQTLAAEHSPTHTHFTSLRDEAAKALSAPPAQESNRRPHALGRLASALRFTDPRSEAHQRIDEFLVLNRILGDDASTLAWFDRVKNDSAYEDLVSRVAFRLNDLLLEHDRWADLGRLKQSPIADLEQAAERRELPEFLSDDLPKEARQAFANSQTQRFRETAGETYAALLAADRGGLAAQYAERARELDESTQMLVALISTALRADVLRAVHLDWIDAIDRPDEALKTLRHEVAAALSNAN